jgi:hypothetical protein
MNEQAQNAVCNCRSEVPRIHVNEEMYGMISMDSDANII